LKTNENILIIGSGGREHALGWKLSQSKKAVKTYYSSGNGGTFENINIGYSEVDKLMSFAKLHNCFTIVGPEEPLVNGIVNSFNKAELKIFGPTKESAMLESSKYFAKKMMAENGIPTAQFSSFLDPEKAKDYVVKQKTNIVIKADGLAAGKGVIICNDKNEAFDAIDIFMIKRYFGNAGDRIIIEEQLFGEELSFIALCDGTTILPLATTQDHKRIFNDDKGPNTGGMGSYSPTTIVDDVLREKIMEKIMKPIVRSMKAKGFSFKGFLYAGLIIEERTKEPFVLEFNVRMGDPECQPLMMRMHSDLLDYLNATVEERLNLMPEIEWKNQFAVCVVMAAKGYPGNYERGELIRGLCYDKNIDTMVFHSGTTRDSKNRVITNGGRVLGVTGLGSDLRNAIANTYRVVEKISWGLNGHYYRNDIAQKALRYQNRLS
jgi:phosphoribosylamine--glycine ligase